MDSSVSLSFGRDAKKMFKFKQKDSEFFDLFVDSARYFYTGALMMDEVMADYNKASEKIKQINELEHQADAVNDKIIDKLNLKGTLQCLVMYRTGKAMTGAVKLTKLLIESTEEIIRAFSLLKDIRRNQAQILDATHKISSLESEGDRVYRHEVAYLFDKVKDPIELIKWKDILEKLEDTLDHCESLSDMIRGVVMKYA